LQSDAATVVAAARLALVAPAGVAPCAHDAVPPLPLRHEASCQAGGSNGSAPAAVPAATLMHFLTGGMLLEHICVSTRETGAACHRTVATTGASAVMCRYDRPKLHSLSEDSDEAPACMFSHDDGIARYNAGVESAAREHLNGSAGGSRNRSHDDNDAGWLNLGVDLQLLEVRGARAGRVRRVAGGTDCLLVGLLLLFFCAPLRPRHGHSCDSLLSLVLRSGLPSATRVGCVRSASASRATSGARRRPRRLRRPLRATATSTTHRGLPRSRARRARAASCAR